MVWPIIAILALVALVLSHWWWRGRLRQAQAAAEEQVRRLERGHQQDALRTQAQQEALFNSMTEGVLLLDQQGRIQLANRALNNLFGISIDIRSRTIMEALRLHELAELVDGLSPQKQVLSRELRISRPNDRWVLVNGSVILNSDGQRQGAVLVFHDLTRLKELERTRQEFVANVSHELRTPLSLIKGYIETLIDGAKDDPEVARKFLETIDRNAERLRLLIEDLLTISELESGRLKLNLRTVALRAVAEKVLVEMQPKAQPKEMMLTDQVPEGLLVHADSDRLEQVLCNLIDNGLKYGRVGGSVVVSARPAEDGLVEVSVQNQGQGIPPDALERIFERFYRVDKARSREQGGTGLGLSIVKHIVRSHGGRAWAASELGRSATIFFTLPKDASRSAA